MPEPESNVGWQHYWRENRLAACVPENPASAAAIEAHWKAYFADLPDGTRVLDVATGNGVLLVWAAQAAAGAGKKLALTGVDLADIDPARFLPEHRSELANAKFIGKTAAESLPSDDGSFDVVVSQYGLEYADLEAALGEVARVLAPYGQLHWLAHGADSQVVEQGRSRLADIELLLAKDGPFAAMKSYVTARTRGRKVSRATQVLTEALRRAEAHCNSHPPAMLVHQLCGGILDTANQFEKYRPADVEHWLDENLRRLRGQRRRTADLLSACLADNRLVQVERLLGAPPWTGAEIASLNVGTSGVPVGQLLHAVRR